jgi:hypothetical protein
LRDAERRAARLCDELTGVVIFMEMWKMLHH